MSHKQNPHKSSTALKFVNDYAHLQPYLSLSMNVHCACCGVELVDNAKGQRPYTLLRFNNGQTYREGADEDWSLCSLKCVRQFGQLAEWCGEPES